MNNLKFKAEFALKPADHPAYPAGYLQLEGVEYPGSSAPGGMNVQDWTIYKSNYDAATEILPEGGVEGEASFIAEHPGEEYPGDVVHDHDFIWIWKGAASAVAKANKIVEDLNNYPVLDDNKHSQLEDEALNEEVDGWAMRDALDQFGYRKNWEDLLTTEEASWMAQQAEANPGGVAEIENSLASIFDLEGEKAQTFRMAVRDGLTYGDWTVVHKEPMVEFLQREAPELLDPEATMHQFLKTEMQNAAPGSAADMKKKEDAGQLRLLESLKVAQQVVAGKSEIGRMVASGETVTKSKSVANMVAKIVGGHLATEAHGGGFFTYAVKGQLMAALFKAHAGDSFGLSWAPMSMFADATQASKVLAGITMLSFDTTTRLKVLSGAMTDIKSVATQTAPGVAATKDDIGVATIGGIVRATKSSGFKSWVAGQGYIEHAGVDPMCPASRLRLSMWAKTPKGFEPVVKELKKKGGVANPWAVAWSMKNKGIKPKASQEDPQSFEDRLNREYAEGRRSHFDMPSPMSMSVQEMKDEGWSDAKIAEYLKKFEIKSSLQSDSSEGIAEAIPGSESIATGGGFEAVVLPTNLLPKSLMDIGTMIAYMDSIEEGQVVVNFAPYNDPGQDSSVYGHSLFLKVPRPGADSTVWKKIADMIVDKVKSSGPEIESWIPDMKSKGANVSPKVGHDVENEEIFTPSSKVVGDLAESPVADNMVEVGWTIEESRGAESHGYKELDFEAYPTIGGRDWEDFTDEEKAKFDAIDKILTAEKWHYGGADGTFLCRVDFDRVPAGKLDEYKRTSAEKLATRLEQVLAEQFGADNVEVTES